MKDHHYPLIAVAAAIAMLVVVAYTRDIVDQLPLCRVAPEVEVPLCSVENAAQCSCLAPAAPLPWRKP